MIQWLFPPRCPVCMQPVLPKGSLIHPICETRLPVLAEPLCKKCGKPLESEEEEYCPVCGVTERVWDRGRSLYLYRGAAGAAVRQIKQVGTEEFVRFFAGQMGYCMRGYLSETRVQCIVPVPLHKSKLKKRGFNQARLLADMLARECGLPVRELLEKNKKTKEQKELPREQRKKNVSGAYQINRRACRDGMPERVLLLDDVVTTGSTLTACAKTLKEAGVLQVFFLTICSGE